VFEHKRPRLFAVTLRAVLVKARHGQTSGGFEDIHPMWVVALYAIHPLFKDWMMLRQIELGMDSQMALKAG
jgi:hypothetical protein